MLPLLTICTMQSYGMFMFVYNYIATRGISSIQTRLQHHESSSLFVYDADAA